MSDKLVHFYITITTAIFSDTLVTLYMRSTPMCCDMPFVTGNYTLMSKVDGGHNNMTGLCI